MATVDPIDNMDIQEYIAKELTEKIYELKEEIRKKKGRELMTKSASIKIDIIKVEDLPQSRQLEKLDERLIQVEKFDRIWCDYCPGYIAGCLWNGSNCPQRR